MNNSALKGIKCIVKATVLTIFFSTACVPQAFQGLPVLVDQSASPNPRAALCDLLNKVGLGDQIQTCLTATSITEDQRAALCAASAQLSEADKNLLRASISAEELAKCDLLAGPTASPSAVPSIEPTAVVSNPTTNPTEVPTTEPTAQPLPTSTVSPLPSPTATSGTGGGSSNGGLGGGNETGPRPTSLDANVVVTNAPLDPITANGTDNDSAD
jgi:hypothetical protein